MAIHLLNWTAVLLLTGIYGFAILSLPGRQIRNVRFCPEDFFAAGFAAAAVFAEVWSLFGPVDRRAFLSFALGGALIALCLFLRHKSASRLPSGRPGPASGPTPSYFLPETERERRGIPVLVFLIPACLIVLYFLAMSSLWPSSYDDYLYHAQALRWTEEYGAVPGLGNLHCRLAYNSAFFPLQALFSWHDIPLPGKPAGVSLHSVNGLIASLIGVLCVLPPGRQGTVLCLPARKESQEAGRTGAGLHLSCLLPRLAGLVYLFGNTHAFTGLDTDPAALAGILYVLIRLTDEFAVRSGQMAVLAMYGVFAAFLCTLKLSAAALLFLAVWPLVHYLKKKDFKTVLSCLAAAFAVTAPFFARGVLLSGYLLYPNTGMDLFSPDWKMPASAALLDREGILLWGRGLYGEIAEGRMTWPEAVSLPFVRWFPVWWGGLSTTGKGLLILCAASAVLALIPVLSGKWRENRPGYYLFTAGLLCLLFWLLSAPLERYGSPFMLIVLSLIPADVLPAGPVRAVSRAVPAFVLAVLLVLRAVSPYNYTALAGHWRELLLVPMDYSVLDMREVPLGGISGGLTVYVPAAGDQGDYFHFPSAQSGEDAARALPRGTGFREGFRAR